MRGEEHRLPVGTRLLDARTELDLHERVESARGFVEHEQVHVDHQGGDQRDLLTVALGVLPSLASRIELESVAQLVTPGCVVPAPHPAEQVEYLGAAQGRPRREITGHERQAPVRLLSLGPRVEAEHVNGTSARPGQAERAPDHGGLARPVRAQEPVDLAGLHGDRQIIERDQGTEPLGQATRLDRRARASSSVHARTVRPPGGEPWCRRGVVMTAPRVGAGREQPLPGSVRPRPRPS